MVRKKYSKSTASFYLKTKSDFFNDNKRLIQKALKQNSIYSLQPKRNKCKICKVTLPKNIDFQSHNIKYIFCLKCNHLNGIFEDTESFSKKIYISNSGSEYSKNYLDKNFIKRTKDIYIPKIDFLISTLRKKNFEILDIGCGTGYFVYASLMRGIFAKGIDINESMVNFGNFNIDKKFGSKPLEMSEENTFYDKIIKTDKEVISAIGVIEHLREPNKFIKAFKLSKAKYLYYSVPMFSLTVILEIIFQNVFPRQLSGAHTHLFTEKSILKLNRLLGTKSVGEWRFGTDIMDLYRNLFINLKSKKTSNKILKYLNENFEKNIDKFQSILDINHSCSEIHVIVKKI